MTSREKRIAIAQETIEILDLGFYHNAQTAKEYHNYVTNKIERLSGVKTV